MALNNQAYYPPVAQPYQHRVLVYEANGLIGHRLVEQFRNDHLIEVNPNLIFGTITPHQKYANELGIDIVIDVAFEELSPATRICSTPRSQLPTSSCFPCIVATPSSCNTS
jgi:hypothetical protein